MKAKKLTEEQIITVLREGEAGARVVSVLERLAEIRGLPEVITMDNGPEFDGRALDERAYRNGVKLNFILMPRQYAEQCLENQNSLTMAGTFFR